VISMSRRHVRNLPPSNIRSCPTEAQVCCDITLVMMQFDTGMSIIIFQNMWLILIHHESFHTPQFSHTPGNVCNNRFGNVKSMWNFSQCHILFGQRVQVCKPSIGLRRSIPLASQDNRIQQVHQVWRKVQSVYFQRRIPYHGRKVHEWLFLDG
jgi:hypothetical protein